MEVHGYEDHYQILKEITRMFHKICYYALNKILNFDWLNSNLNFVDVWLSESNVRQRNFISGQ